MLDSFGLECSDESVFQDVQYINALLTQFSLESPFPFKSLNPNESTTAEKVDFGKAIRILISLLGSKQALRGFFRFY